MIRKRRDFFLVLALNSRAPLSALLASCPVEYAGNGMGLQITTWVSAPCFQLHPFSRFVGCRVRTEQTLMSVRLVSDRSWMCKAWNTATSDPSEIIRNPSPHWHLLAISATITCWWMLLSDADEPCTTPTNYLLYQTVSSCGLHVLEKSRKTRKEKYWDG